LGISNVAEPGAGTQILVPFAVFSLHNREDLGAGFPRSLPEEKLMSAVWYCDIDGTQHGPMSPYELKDLADQGKLQVSHLIWKEGMPTKVPARTVRGLFDKAPPPPAKPSSPPETPAAKTQMAAPLTPAAKTQMAEAPSAKTQMAESPPPAKTPSAESPPAAKPQAAETTTTDVGANQSTWVEKATPAPRLQKKKSRLSTPWQPMTLSIPRWRKMW
jgi:hypothetical protein